MISIGGRSPFEAALFANCHFSAAFEENTVKIKRLIGKLSFYVSLKIIFIELRSFHSRVFQHTLHLSKCYNLRIFYFIFIEKLQYRLNGSIVIMCATRADVKFVSGHLTQANIKCIELDDQYSGNQMSKLDASNFFSFLLKLETKSCFR